MTARPDFIDNMHAKYRNGLGEWVPREKVHPATNVWQRPYRTADGNEGIFPPYDPSERIVAYFFPTMFAEIPRAGKRKATP